MTESPDAATQDVVYDLSADCTSSDVSTGEYFHATVNGIVPYGIFVDISEELSGLIHESDLSGAYEVGDELVVELIEVREDGDLSFAPVESLGEDAGEFDEFEAAQSAQTPFETVERDHEYERTAIGTLEERTGADVTVEGAVVQIKQTSGPTVFTVRDETGVVGAPAFEAAGVRAYPEVELDDAVTLSGTVERHDGAVQLEVSSLTVQADEQAATTHERLAVATEQRAQPHDVDPLIEWPALTKLFPDLEALAQQLRQAVLEGRPIRIRHHADGDGTCASVPVQLALERFIAEVHEDEDAPRHLLRRSPSKAPFYEMEDATRDLNFALSDQERHGQKLPLLLMLDNGSTAEDVPAYEALAEYDVPIHVVDHHHPDPDAVGALLESHVNPYLHDDDYRITTGMLCVELARMIDPALTDELTHVPAVAGISDRSKADAMDDYLALAEAAGYDRSDVQDVSDALGYQAFFLRFDPGTPLVRDVIGIETDEQRHDRLVSLLSEQARDDVDDQLDAALPHVERETLENGARLCTVDVELYANRFTYPPPGKTTGEIHDREISGTGDPVITVGYGPDFAVLRSDGVRLDIPEMVSELSEEIDGAGVHGGGHLVVGSVKFVEGMRETVLDALYEKIGRAELDEELQAGRPR